MNKITFLITLLLLTSCHSDNFYETKRYFKTNKNTYKIGENIELTAVIKPDQEDKKIRFYDNYKNIEISFALINDSLSLYNSYWSMTTGDDLAKTEIIEQTITQNHPFKKVFQITTKEQNDSVILSIPEMNYEVSFASSLIFNNNTTLRIHGFCNPIDPEIGASLEEYFEVKDIRVRK